MIKALIDIGEVLKDEYPVPFTSIPYLNFNDKKPPKVLVVDLKEDNNTLEFSKIFLANYNSDDARKKYYFREGSAQGAAPSLSFKCPAKSSALRQRLRILTNLGYKVDIEELAKRIEENVEHYKAQKEIFTSVLIVLRIGGKWPSENKKFLENFEENILNSLATKNFRKYWIRKGICYGCGKEKIIYAGLSKIFGPYTVDKYGYAPELNPKIAWKEFALCKDCIYNLERGKRAIDDYLTFTFYGKSFWLIPVAEGKFLKDVLNKFKEYHKGASAKIKEEFERHEDELLYVASEQKNVISYQFAFTKKEQGALRILLHIEEVLPSVLSKFVSKKIDTEKEFNRSVKDAIGDYKIKFTFFSSSGFKNTTTLPGFTDKDFFNIVDRVFRRAPISEGYLISKTMQRVQGEMAQEGEKARVPKNTVLEAFLSLEFLLKWGILKRKTGGSIMQESAFDEFFDKHSDFFNHPAKKGLVLLGVLVQKFLNHQYKQRGSTPFLRVLKNLRLNQKDVQSVFRALQNKMNEYEIGHWWPELRKGIGSYFIEAGDKWPLSSEEIGFYIAIGMSVHSLPVFGKQSEEELENE